MAPFLRFKTLTFSHLGGEGKIRVRHFLQKTFHSPQTRIRGVSVSVRALAKLEKMDNAFTNNKLTKNKALLLLL